MKSRVVVPFAPSGRGCPPLPPDFVQRAEAAATASNLVCDRDLLSQRLAHARRAVSPLTLAILPRSTARHLAEQLEANGIEVKLLSDLPIALFLRHTRYSNRLGWRLLVPTLYLLPLVFAGLATTAPTAQGLRGGLAVAASILVLLELVSVAIWRPAKLALRRPELDP